MTVVVLGIDALDYDLVDADTHSNLSLQAKKRITTIDSSEGTPSTHELWPTIITGLPPAEHGLELDGGVGWDHPILSIGSSLGQLFLPNELRTRLGRWILNNTNQDTFRTSANYYDQNGINTVFDDHVAKAIGIPNYVVDHDAEDREHELRRNLGDLFQRDDEVKSGHRSSNPEEFYELCLEMVMIRIARVRRALRSQQYELVFGYTSGLDLIGHVTFDRPELQLAAYGETDQFVGELVTDLDERDELLLVSDHGLQDGVHTHDAMVASTDPDIIDPIEGVKTVRAGIEHALQAGHHAQTGGTFDQSDTNQAHQTSDQAQRVKDQLEDLGYL